MKKRIAILIVSIGLIATAILFWPPSTPSYRAVEFADSISIAPPDEALTFARASLAGQTTLLAVLEYRGNQLTALDLSTLMGDTYDDPIELFNAVGYGALQQQIESQPIAARRLIEVSSLIEPVRLTDSHVAAGTNFAAHADESSVDEGPFLFAKLVNPTPFNADVVVGDRLLDYEVELAFVTLSNCSLDSVPAHMGLILTNDYTDRAKLMRHLNPDDVVSGDGFTTGKSAPGFLPIGNLFVIPRDLQAFANSIELNLSVNGELRQSASMELAIWDIQELFRQISSRRDTSWMHMGNQIGLPVAEGILPSRTLILSGTPAGTVFSGISTRVIARGALRWIAGGWGKPIKQQVLEQYIDQAEDQGHYLQPGDEVTIQVNRMGRIKNAIR